MSHRIAIGVGCRRGSPASAIEALIRHALERTPAAERLGVFTFCGKVREEGLIEAAGRLGLNVVFLAPEVLREQAAYVQTHSAASKICFDVPSVAEASALAGAGPGAVLILPRVVGEGVTCAIAASRISA